MVEDIKLIKNSDVSHFQDTLLMIFWRRVTEGHWDLLNQRGELPAKLQTAADELLAAVGAMQEAFILVNTKSMSEEIKRKDQERDKLLVGVKKLLEGMLRLAPTGELHAAAEALQKSLDDWRIDLRQAYTLENTIMGKWLREVSQSEELTQAAARLGLTDTLWQLGELCGEVDSLINDRNELAARKKAMQQRQRRKESEARWRTFVLVLNAAAVMDPDELRYDAFIRVVNLELKELRRQMRHTRRKNPRERTPATLPTKTGREEPTNS